MGGRFDPYTAHHIQSTCYAIFPVSIPAPLHFCQLLVDRCVCEIQQRDVALGISGLASWAISRRAIACGFVASMQPLSMLRGVLVTGRVVQ